MWGMKHLLIFLLQIPGRGRKGIATHNSRGKHKAVSWGGHDLKKSRRRKANGAESMPATAGGHHVWGAKLRMGRRARREPGQRSS